MKEYLPVNWVDGMKINKTHFVAQYDAVTFQQAQLIQALLTNDNYGFIPAADMEENNKIIVGVDNQQQVNVKILSCQAVTRGGFLIDVRKSVAALQTPIPELNKPLSSFGKKSVTYYVVLSVDPYNRIPAGTINTNEIPPRLPYTAPSYQLHLMPEEEVTSATLGAFLLPVAKIHIQNQQVQLVTDYIPPCTTIASHRFLLEVFAEFEAFIGKIERLALQIVQKILQKKQQNDLSLPVQKMCENVGIYISAVYDGFKFKGSSQSPATLVPVIAGLGRNMMNSLDIYLGTGKEEVYNYFKETCGIDQAKLENAIVGITGIRYSHLDVATGIQKAKTFLQIAQQLFTTLAALDYIGKRKETGIFVKEEPLVKDKPRLGNFLAD